MMKLNRKVFRKLKKIIRRIMEMINPPISDEEKNEMKKKEDYEFLISQGVETQYGYVTLLGKPIINRAPNSRIIIGKGVVLLSESCYNVAGVNHPCVLATMTEGAEIILEDGVGMSGTSVCAMKSVRVGEKTMCGVNTNIWDTDFHPIDPQTRITNNSIHYAGSKPINIGKNVWLGGNSTILKGVEIGDNSVIGAMSLVSHNVGENQLFAGNPAVFIRSI